MKPNIIELVVNNNTCIGCGVCDTICPVNVLNMDFNSVGLYEPIESEGCLDKCTLCIDVCPFIPENNNEFEISTKLYKNEIGINYHKELGYFVETLEIHKKDLTDRLKSASGGAGNFILTTLLDSRIVDKIITVESLSNSDKLFQFNVFSSSEELENTKGSVYYPTDLSEVLDYIMKNDGDYAITVLPCYAKAIRLAQDKSIKLRKRIKVLIGLVCGQMKTKKFTTELSKLAIETDNLIEVKYRIKNVNKHSNQYSLKFKKSSVNSKMIEWTKYSNKFWTSRLFTPLACNNCIDTFALTADISLMDAWLPEYIKDYRGHTLVIVRTNELKKIFSSQKDISCEHISADKVLESQKGVVENKHYFVYGTYNPLKKIIIRLKIKIQKLSHDEVWNEKLTDKYILQIKILEKLNGWASLPIRFINKILKKGF